MRRIIILVLTTVLSAVLHAQVEHIAELPIQAPNVTYNYDRHLDIYTEHDFVIMPHIRPNASTQETVLYNKTTGSISIAPVFIFSRHEVFGENLYSIKQGATALRYAKLQPNGNFQIVPDPPFIPDLEEGGRTYGKVNNTLYSANLDGSDVRAIALLPGPWYGPAQYAVHGDTIFIAGHQQFTAFSIADSTYHNDHAQAIEHNNLTFLKNSHYQGRFVYFSELGEGIIQFYELGKGIGKRYLGEISLEKEGNVSSVFGGEWTFLHRDAVASKNDITYLALWIDAGWPAITNTLIKLNRSQSSAGAELIQSFRRSNEIRQIANQLAILDDNSLVAMGLFGKEGFEPYGIAGDGFKVLQDFIPGPYGGLDMNFGSEFLSTGNRDLRVSVWQEKAWFLAAHRHYGIEISYSDGTEAGTQMLQDLVPGARGISYFALAGDGDEAYIYAQHQDKSYHLYRIGPEMPAVVSPHNDATWSVMLGDFPDRPTFTPSFYDSRGNIADFTIDASSGSIYFLGHKAPAANIIGDTINPFYTGPGPDVYRLQKLHKESGQVEWSTMFDNYGFTADAKLATDKEGNIHMLRYGTGDYWPESAILEGETPVWNHENFGIYLYSFTPQGELEQIRQISGLNATSSLLHFSIDDQNQILYALRYSKSIEINSATMDGSLLESKMLAVQETQSTTDFEQVGDHFVASAYTSSDNCSTCTAWLYLLGPSLELLRFERVRYSGKLVKPKILPGPNGEIWFTGGGNARLLVGTSQYQVDLSGSGPFQQEAFILRWSGKDGVLLSGRVFGDNMKTYLGAHLHYGSVVMAYTVQDSSFAQFPFLQNLYLGTAPPEPLYLRMLQFDQLGQDVDSYSTPVILSSWNTNLAYHPIISDKEDWLFAIYPESGGRVHADTLIPPPIFARSNYRVQLLNKKWPFESLPELSQNASQNEFQQLVNLYPNPSSGVIFLVPNQGNVIPYDRMEVYDMHGRYIYGQVIAPVMNFLSVDLGTRLNAGKYVIRLVGDQESESHHIVLIK